MQKICSKIGSGATPKGGKTSYIDEGISLIRSTNVFDFRFEYSDLAHINQNQADALANVTVEQNDVLFNITGVSVARCCMVPDNVLPARVNQHVMIVRPIKGENMSYYIMFTLCSADNKADMTAARSRAEDDVSGCCLYKRDKTVTLEHGILDYHSRCAPELATKQFIGYLGSIALPV